MSHEEVIGWVDWPDWIRATLHADGTWSVPGCEWIEDGLKLVYSDSYRGPSAGPFGPAQLAALAGDVGGTFHLEPTEEPEEGLMN